MIPRYKHTYCTTTSTTAMSSITIGKQFSFLLLTSIIQAEEKHWLTKWFPKTFRIIPRQQEQQQQQQQRKEKRTQGNIACSQSTVHYVPSGTKQNSLASVFLRTSLALGLFTWNQH